MDLFLFVVGISGFAISIVLLIISFVKKRPKKIALIGLGVSVIMAFTGLFMGSTDDLEDVADKPSQETEEEDKEIKSNSEDAEEDIEYTIGIEIEFHEHVSGNIHMTVAGKTNLSDGEDIIISVISEEHDYNGGDTQEVKDGIYVSEPFSNHGGSLESGEYRIIVETVETGKAKAEKITKID